MIINIIFDDNINNYMNIDKILIIFEDDNNYYF